MPPTFDPVEFLSRYREVQLTSDFRFTILHLYPGEPCRRPNGELEGFFDSKFFHLELYNVEDMLVAKIFGDKDQLDFNGICPRYARVYADGAFLLKFDNPVAIDGLTQVIQLGRP